MAKSLWRTRVLAGMMAYVLLVERVAGSINITVDDNAMDSVTGSTVIVYSPADRWSLGPTCSVCAIHPDASDASNGTWHDTAYDASDDALDIPQTASLSFKGTAVYVYAIQSHLSDPNCNADQSFWIDGVFITNYTLAPTGSPSFDYNVLLYKNETLEDGSHTLMLQNGWVGGPHSQILLDYIVYTSTDSTTSPSPSSSSSTASTGTQMPSSSISSPSQLSSSTASPSAAASTGASTTSTHTVTILASILGVVCVLFLVVAVMLFYFWRRIRGTPKVAYTNVYSPQQQEYPPPQQTRHTSGIVPFITEPSFSQPTTAGMRPQKQSTQTTFESFTPTTFQSHPSSTHVGSLGHAFADSPVATSSTTQSVRGPVAGSVAASVPPAYSPE
ncbi:hypothetical protein BC835DRAFT_416699 [Cytidiella melzeri]|nr:hypothetical protein BC835DRAFT_416699 [Cytidiella melzeri]